MPRSRHCLALAVAALAVTTAGCGGNGDDDVTVATRVPDGAVAVVGTTGVPATRFERALRARVAGASPLTGSTAGTTPLDPPRYRRCVASVREQARRVARTLPRSKRPADLPTAQLRANCRQLMASARQAAEADLIQAEWIRQEAARAGVRVTTAQTETALEQFIFSAAQPAGGKAVTAERARARFDRRLQSSGVTRADVLLQLRTQLLQQRLIEKRTKEEGGGKPLGPRATQRLQIQFQNDLQRDWRPRTLCAAGHVVPQCRNGAPLTPLPLPPA